MLDAQNLGALKADGDTDGDRDNALTIQEREIKMIRVSVLYPQGGKFDFDYYVNKHMRLVHKLLDSYGLVKTEVDKGIGTVPFAAAGHLVFKTIEDMQKALQDHDPELAADLVNFTDVKPQFQISEIVG
jgi:uncharacterized protein (TIGR02118 family)